MISGSPSLFVWSVSEPQPVGLESFFDRYTEEYAYYGSGKAALFDGLATICAAGENVLVPSYLPDAVVEPIVDRGLEPRHYALTEGLKPDLADLESRIDDDTAAIMSVNYFGFPQPGIDELTSIAEAHGCFHIDDNAHASVSVDDETLLGTRGHIGITSLWKLLPVPNGAVLYLNDESVADRYDPSSFAGVTDRIDAADCRFIMKSFAADVLSANSIVKQSVDTLVAGGYAGKSVSDPSKRYQTGKTPMSKLTAHVIADADPNAIRRQRRENFTAWQHLFSDRNDVEPLYHWLPPGISPQVFPVRTSNASQLIRELENCGVGGAHTWPRLSQHVLENPQYETATRLSREVVVLPIHQHIDPAAIASVGDSLRR